MSALLIQAPDSKRWHVGVFVLRADFTGTGTWLPACKMQLGSGPWRLRGSAYTSGRVGPWRTPHGICTYCARVVESAVRLVATEEVAG